MYRYDCCTWQKDHDSDCYLSKTLGYRAILDAMKSFADESEYPTLVDIEVI